MTASTEGRAAELRATVDSGATQSEVAEPALSRGQVPDEPEQSKKLVYETSGCVVTVPESGFTEVDCGKGKQPEKASASGPSAGELGGRAVEELRLPSPVIRLSPSEDAVQMVRVPTWLWVERGVWEPVAETVSVPGLSVTATARPVRVVWSMGDGGQVVCDGPGTPYSEAFGPEAVSPDCGYTYSRSSVNEPEGTFTVSAAVTWDVAWEGGGESGLVPGLVTVDEAVVTVDEIQALVLSGTGR